MSDTTTVGERHALGRDPRVLPNQQKEPRARGDSETTSIRRRFSSRFDIMDRPKTLTAHRPSDALQYPYTAYPNKAPCDFLDAGTVVRHEESKCHVSIKLQQTTICSNSEVRFY